MKGDFDRVAFVQLLGQVLDADAGRVNAADRERLNALLIAQPEARRLYRQHMDLHARLHLDYSGGLPPEAMPGGAATAAPTQPPATVRFPQAVLAIAAILVIGLFAVALLRTERTNTEPFQQGITNEIAVLSRSLGVKWSDAASEYREGDALPPGPFRIAAGVAQIEFFGGASVIVEGPAELNLISAERVVFKSGRLNALVPEPARGFVVEGPDFEAVDLGTQFALSVDPTGHSEIHVLDGEVDLREQGDGALVKKLTKGDAGRMQSGASSFEPISSAGSGFIDPQELLNRTDKRWESSYTEWRQSRTRWINDPATLVYFDFENQQSWDRELSNQKAGGPNAAIIGARWVTGRWPGKGALEFKRITDRVRMHVPGEMTSLTFAAWVRVEGLDRRYNSLLLTDGWDPGEAHWHIGIEGKLIFGIKGIGDKHSDPILGTDDLGRWLHLAVTFDATSRQICHYRDGALVSTSQPLKSLPVRLGDCEIGNWQSKDTRASGVRSFNGRIDEFLISQRALSAAEIRAHYDIGNPYR